LELAAVVAEEGAAVLRPVTLSIEIDLEIEKDDEARNLFRGPARYLILRIYTLWDKDWDCDVVIFRWPI
jgi:hypothetical protein